MERLYQREFAIADTHGFQNVETIDIRKTSAGLGWNLAFVSVQEEGPYKRHFSARHDVLLSVVNHGIMKGRLVAEGKDHQLDGGPGTITILPGNVSFSVELDTTISSTNIYLRRCLVEQVARNLYGEDATSVVLPVCAAAYDPVLEHLCHAVRQALDDPDDAQCRPYIEHLLQAIVAYLLRNHPVLKTEARGGSGRLSQRQLRQVTELVEARVGNRMTLADVASHFDCSADHFGRLFKNTTGLTLYQFMIRCRIDRARYLLSETDMPIVTIAQECGFADQVHLTRAMRRNTGITPAAYRKRSAQTS